MSNLLRTEREVLARALPGLEDALSALGFVGREVTEGAAIEAFRAYDGPGLLMPAEYGGLGCSALTALQVQIALGSLAPSLAVGTSMHHYKVAALASCRGTLPGIETLLATIGENRWLVGSGGAEGQADGRLYEPTVTASENGLQILVNGTKRPCSLTWSMDVLSMMVRSTPESRFGGQLLHIFVNARDPTITKRQFWSNPVLLAAESHQVTLLDTPVDERMIVPIGTSESAAPFALAAYAWFELISCGAYLGCLARLVELCLEKPRCPAERLAEWISTFETLRTALTTLAQELDRKIEIDAMSRLLRIRYHMERQIAATSQQCLLTLGGLSFATDTEATYFASACLALHFHPPSFSSMAKNLADQVDGGNLVLA